MPKNFKDGVEEDARAELEALRCLVGSLQMLTEAESAGMKRLALKRKQSVREMVLQLVREAAEE